MDDKWFIYVGGKLAKIESENAKRYSKISRRTLIHHPMIVSSQYWHATDADVFEDCFDWHLTRYPYAYVKTLTRVSWAVLRDVAQRPYRADISFAQMREGAELQIENQKTLVARLLILQLEHLLSEVQEQSHG